MSEFEQKTQQGNHYFYAIVLPKDPFKVDSQECVTFALVPASTENEDALGSVEGGSVEDYNNTVLTLANQQTVSLNQLTCTDNPYGFTVSHVLPGDEHKLTGECEDDSDIEDDSGSEGEYLSDGDDDREFVRIASHARHMTWYKRVHEKPIPDHETGPGTVTYKGYDWPFHRRLGYEHVGFLEAMYSFKKKGFGNRPSCKVGGCWGFVGSRRTAQASNSNEYPNSKGDDLYQQSNDVAVMVGGTRIINSLCKESEDTLEMGGDSVTRLSIDFRNGQPVGTASMKVCLMCAVSLHVFLHFVLLTHNYATFLSFHV